MQVQGAAVPVLAAGLLGAGLLATKTASAEPARYEIDPEHVVVAFFVEHLGFARVLGSFTAVSGSFVFDEDSGELGAVEVVIETNSVGSSHAARDEHLRSGDFLDVADFPVMRFAAPGATRTGETTFAVAGELTLLGVTRPLTVAATWNKSGDYPIGRNAYAMGVSARAVLRRSEFGMTYAVDNGWVGDEVEIVIEFEARRQ